MSDVSLIIKMVDEVVKPLTGVQEALAGTQGDFSQTTLQLEQITYQFVALRDCFETESKHFAGQNAYLDELGQTLSRSFKALEELDIIIQQGIVNAASDLRDAISTEVRTGVQSEVTEAVVKLNQAINSARNTLTEHQSITWMTHAKFIGIALLTGLLVGAFTVWWGFRKLYYLPCHCQCVLSQKQEGDSNAVKPTAETPKKNAGKPQVEYPKFRRR